MAFSSRLLKSLLGLFGYKFTRNIKHIFRKVYFPWRGSVCAQLFSVISIHCQALLRVFLITSYLILSIVLFTRSRVQSYAPPPKKKKGEGSEGTVLLRRPLASVSPWVREGGGGGVRLHIGHRFVYACLTHGISLLDQ